MLFTILLFIMELAKNNRELNQANSMVKGCLQLSIIKSAITTNKFVYILEHLNHTSSVFICSFQMEFTIFSVKLWLRFLIDLKEKTYLCRIMLDSSKYVFFFVYNRFFIYINIQIFFIIPCMIKDQKEEEIAVQLNYEFIYFLNINFLEFLKIQNENYLIL